MPDCGTIFTGIEFGGRGLFIGLPLGIACIGMVLPLLITALEETLLATAFDVVPGIG
jgi:hypothetical protein